MDRQLLIIADKDGHDIAAVQDYTLDLAYGSGENDFELHLDDYELKGDEYIYLDGTGYGGIVDSITYDTNTKKTVYKGRTWHGILQSRIITPPYDEDYYYASGDIDSIVWDLLSEYDLHYLFMPEQFEDSDCEVDKYKFKRYQTVYDGMCDLLSKYGYKPVFKVKMPEVQIALEKINTITSVDSDLMDFQIEKVVNSVNHLICLGKGELKERTVIHLYADDKGNISKQQSIFGKKENIAVYDYPNAETPEDLEKDGRKRLKELNSSGRVDVDLNEIGDWEVGDYVQATETSTGLTVKSRIKKKIIKVKDGYADISFDIGEAE